MNYNTKYVRYDKMYDEESRRIKTVYGIRGRGMRMNIFDRYSSALALNKENTDT